MLVCSVLREVLYRERDAPVPYDHSNTKHTLETQQEQAKASRTATTTTKTCKCKRALETQTRNTTDEVSSTKLFGMHARQLRSNMSSLVVFQISRSILEEPLQALARRLVTLETVCPRGTTCPQVT